MKKIKGFAIPFVVVFVVLGGVIYLMGVHPASAITSPYSSQGAIQVTTLEDELNDDGDCSLREAVAAANGNAAVDACPAGDSVLTDTITFDVSGIINVTSQLSVTASGPLVIDGGEVITTSGGGTTRVWWVDSGAELSLNNLAVVNGESGDGGGIYNLGTLVINNCTLSDNDSNIHGGGIYNLGILTVSSSIFEGNTALYESGAIENRATLTVTHSIFTNNSITGGGGGGIGTYHGSISSITNSTFSANIANVAGGIDNAGDITVIDCTISGNTARDYGGGIANWGQMTIKNSTISDNIADDYAGGIYDNSSYYAGDLIIINSTISGNSAGSFYGGGIYTAPGTPATTLSISYSTISDNSAPTGGGIYNNGETSLLSTIIADNPSGSDCLNNSGTISDAGHNLDSDNSCGLLPANGSLPGTNPQLGPLHNNGGPTYTHALLIGSAAIDAGDNDLCPSADQRGVPRPLDGNNDGIADCDIGAFEFGAVEYIHIPLIYR